MCAITRIWVIGHQRAAPRRDGLLSWNEGGLRAPFFYAGEGPWAACAEGFVSRLTREFLLSVVGMPDHPKETKRSCPYLRSALRSDFPRSVVARPAIKGAGRSQARSKAPLPRPLSRKRARGDVWPKPTRSAPSPACGRPARGEGWREGLLILIYPPPLSQAKWNLRVRGRRLGCAAGTRREAQSAKHNVQRTR